MAGVDDGRLVFLVIQHHHDDRHKTVDLQHGDAIVQLRHRRRRMAFAGQTVFGLGRDFGHHHRRRHSVSDHVGDQNRGSAVRQADVVIVIPADMVRGRIERHETIAAQQRRPLREERLLHLLRQFQILFEILLPQGTLVQLGVVDRDPRLNGHACKNLQVVLSELFPLVQGIQLDHSQRGALGVEQRSAHHRADAQISDALADVGKLRRGVLGQHGLLGIHHLAYDRAADPDRLVAALASPGPARNQAAVVGLQHDETAVGLNKDLEQTVQNLRQHLVQRQRAAQVASDLDQRRQPRLDAGRQLQGARRTRAHVHFGKDRRSRRIGPLVHQNDTGTLARIVRRSHVQRAADRPLRRRGIVVESEHDVANADQIAVLQQLRLFADRNVVQECPVAAAHVLDVEPARAARELSVLPADSSLLGQRDVAVGLTTNRRLVAVQFVTASGLRTNFNFEISHAIVSRFRVVVEQGKSRFRPRRMVPCLILSCRMFRRQSIAIFTST